MNNGNLYKGFEVELFTGSQNNHVGVSDDIAKTFSNFVKEPDNRNVEYITAPEKDYKLISKNLFFTSSTTSIFLETEISPFS